MNDLKRCPFCGGEARIKPFRTWDNQHHCMGLKYYVECQSCFIDGPGFHWTQQDAADAWNKREEPENQKTRKKTFEDSNPKEYMTIRQAAAIPGMPSEYYLRIRHKQGKLPGFYTGNRFLVNVSLLSEMLKTEAAKELAE